MSTPSGVAHADNKTMVLAFYFVGDVSYSMDGEGIDAMNTVLPQVMDAIDVSPTLGDVVRFGAMDFSDDAQVVLRLGDLRDVDVVPTFSVRGGTSFAAAFRLLRKEIEQDMAQLKGDNYQVYRPAVFFVTDGAPTDDPADLAAAFAELTDPTFKARPNIIPFGVPGTTKDAIDLWVYPKPGDGKRPMRSYLAGPDVSIQDAIGKIAEVLIASIIASAGSVATNGAAGGFIPPDDEDLDDWI
jgi:uncharacterized protein YegL